MDGPVSAARRATAGAREGPQQGREARTGLYDVIRGYLERVFADGVQFKARGPCPALAPATPTADESRVGTREETGGCRRLGEVGVGVSTVAGDDQRAKVRGGEVRATLSSSRWRLRHFSLTYQPGLPAVVRVSSRSRGPPEPSGRPDGSSPTC
eukprot:scaffold2175_cov381-Prasinococcus_capsulatus_cf.AAC.15